MEKSLNKKCIILSTLLLLLHCSCFNHKTATLKTSSLPFETIKQLSYNKPIVAAHRGFHLIFPDNSRSAISDAIEETLPLIEIDVRESKEGTLFLFHDKILTPSNIISPKEFYLRDVSTLSDQQLNSVILQAKEPSKIAFFADVLIAIKESSSLFLIDVKSAKPTQTMKKIIKLAENLNVSDRIIIQTQLLDELKYLRQEFPHILTHSRCHNKQDIISATPLKPAIIQVDIDWIQDEDIKEIKSKDIMILMKSLGSDNDQQETWNEIINKGTNIILTDHPKDLLNFIIIKSLTTTRADDVLWNISIPPFYEYQRC